MVQRAADLISPTREHLLEKADAARALSAFPGPGREDLGLVVQIRQALRTAGYPALRGIEIAVRARKASLAGQVPSYYLKQVAQTVALSVPGVQQIRNDLRVVSLD